MIELKDVDAARSAGTLGVEHFNTTPLAYMWLRYLSDDHYIFMRNLQLLQYETRCVISPLIVPVCQT